MLTFTGFLLKHILMPSTNILIHAWFSIHENYKELQRLEIDYCLHTITRETGLQAVLLMLFSHTQLRNGNVQMTIYENYTYFLESKSF